jgi:hypothetical protein
VTFPPDRQYGLTFDLTDQGDAGIHVDIPHGARDMTASFEALAAVVAALGPKS